MLKSISAALLLTASASTLGADYKLDPAHTFVYFAVNHAALATAYGRFNKVEGTLSMDREQGTGSLEVVIDADSIDTNHEKRDNHMRSPDFLNAVEFPEITFKSTEVSFEGEDKATVTGDLTILGVTKPVTLDVSDIVCGTHIIYNYEACGFAASTTLKRSDFGMTYGLPDAVGDELRLFLSTEAVKQ